MKDVKNWKENWSYFDGFKYIKRESKKRTKGLKWIPMFFDAVKCLRKYGATFHDYINLRFYDKTPEERATFITTKIVQKQKSTWDKEKMDMVDNKWKFAQFFPECVNRETLDLDNCSREEFQNFLEGKKSFFRKAKRESSGFGVSKFVVSEISDLKAFFEENYQKGFLLEEEIFCHPLMAELNPDSKSQIRVVTVTHAGTCNILATSLRTGGKTDVLFNTAADDLFAQIDIKTGICFTDGVDESGTFYENHPISGIKFKGFQIPNWDYVIAKCKEAALKIPEVEIIGWDVCVTENGCSFFEGNPGSGVASMQIADAVGKKALLYKYLGK